MRTIGDFSRQQIVRQAPAYQTDDIRQLITAKPGLLETTGDYNQTLLHAAVWNNREELVELLLGKGCPFRWPSNREACRLLRC